MSNKDEGQSSGLSRRKFLGALGTGAVAQGVLGVPDAEARDSGRFRDRHDGHAGHHDHQRHQPRFVIREDRFGRIFPQVAPFFNQAATPQLATALLELGKPGGIMDAKDTLDIPGMTPEQVATQLIADPALSVNNPDNPTHTAGTTFFGQFMDHDMTFDLNSRLGVPTVPEESPNERTPAFDLDSVYGGGPIADPELYEAPQLRGKSKGPGIRLRIESGGLFEDVPRTLDDVAIISDPRNDENMMISGLQCAFILFHNNAVDYVAARNRRADPEELFAKARQLTTWHYHWMILHEFLPQFIGQPLVDEILTRGRRFYRPQSAFIPVEFQGSCYRFGHSMVRPSYRANLAGDNDGGPFFGFIFDPRGDGVQDPLDLRGFNRAPRRFIGWQTFFDFGDGAVRRNKRIDSKVSTPLFNLPRATIPAPDGPTSLVQRNLLRHITWSLPSGQALAATIGVPQLAAADLSEVGALGHSLDTATPLFYYILKEAEVMADGLTLGPVGGRIVGEVIIGLLQLDRNSFLAVNPSWRPTLPDRFGQLTGDFRMVDFLTFAGVSPAQRGQ